MEIHFNCTVCVDAPVTAFILTKLLAGKSIRATALETKFSISVVSRHTRRCIDAATHEAINKARAKILECLVCADPQKARIVERELLAGRGTRSAVKRSAISINPILRHLHECMTPDMQLRIKWESLQTAKRKIVAANAIRFAEVRKQRELQRKLKAEMETEIVLKRKTASPIVDNVHNSERPARNTQAALRRYGSEMLQPGEFIGESPEREARFLLALVCDQGTYSVESLRKGIPINLREQAELKKLMLPSEVDRLRIFRDNVLTHFDRLSGTSLEEIKQKAERRRKQLEKEYARLTPNGPHSVPTRREGGDEWTI